MKLLLFLIFNYLTNASCNGQVSDETFEGNEVELYQQYSANDSYKDFYEKDSDTPYTGRLISKSHSDKVLIDFTNGKMDGVFLRFNGTGDTLEYRQYNRGNELYAIQYKYESGKLVLKDTIKKETGNAQDFEIFDKVKKHIKNSEFEELDIYLNTTYSNYQGTFMRLISLFGELKDFKILIISKEQYEYNKSEHLRAEISLLFETNEILADFLIVKYPDKLKGQAFSFKSMPNEILKDKIIIQIIRAVNKNEVDAIIKMTQYTEQHKIILEQNLNKIGTISDTYEFLNSHFEFFNDTKLIKDYLVTVDDEKQVLSLIYKIGWENKLELLDFSFKPYRRRYMVMHRIL